MRKVFINKWLLLAAALTLSLSTISFINFKKADRVCNIVNECPEGPAAAGEGGEILLDVISRKFTPLISVQ